MNTQITASVVSLGQAAERQGASVGMVEELDRQHANIGEIVKAVAHIAYQETQKGAAQRAAPAWRSRCRRAVRPGGAGCALACLLDLPEPEGPPPAEEAILVVRLNGERMGIVVTAFEAVMETIAKPLEGVLTGLRGFTGTTLLGDGRVLLILDPPERLA